MHPACFHCKKRPASVTSAIRKQAFCRPCFLELTESRLRSGLRLWNLSDKRIIYYADDSSAPAAATRYILQVAFSHARKRIVALKSMTKNKDENKDALLPISLEEACTQGMDAFFEGRKFRLPKSATLLVPFEELEAFCRIKKLAFEQNIKKKLVSNSFLEQMQDHHPQTYFSFIQTLIRQDP